MNLSKHSLHLRLAVVALCVLLLLGFSNSIPVFAQDPPTEIPSETSIELPATDIPTPTDLPSATPVEIPTDLPTASPSPTATETEIPTNTPTDEATAVSFATDTLATATYVPTLTQTSELPSPTNTLSPTEDTSLQPEPPLGLLFADTFDSGDLSHWTIGAGWSLVPHDNGLGFQVFNSTAIAQFISNSLMDVVVQSDVLVDNGMARIVVRQTDTDSYSVMLNAAGQVNLYRSGILLQSTSVAPSAPSQWRTLRLSVISDTLRVSVDGMQVIALRDSSTLPTGAISVWGIFGVSTDTITPPQHTIQVDNFSLFVPMAQIPTSTPTATSTDTTTATFTPTNIPAASPSPTRTPTKTPTGTGQQISGAQTYTVNTTDDTSDGVCDATHCSLREAITDANANTGTDTIAFNIPGTAPFVIKPTLALPTITGPVILDATLQPGYNGSPLVVLDGSNLGVVDGLTFITTAHPSKIRGFDIVFWGGEGIKTTGASITAEANYIGIDYTGNIAQPNGHNGIYIIGSSSRIGGTTTAQRNIISGNLMNGILVEPPSTSTPQTLTQIMGNYIGTNAAGTADVGNKLKGVSIKNSDQNTIGGDTTAYRNIISGNDGGAILVTGTGNTAQDNHIRSNYIGTDVTGTAVIANGSPIIQISQQQNSMGGCTGFLNCNVIVGNGGTGILLQSGSSVSAAYIGMNASGTAPLGSLDIGIDVTGSNGDIGAFNVIANYQTAGIRLSGSQNTVSGNYIGTNPTGTVDWVSGANAVGILITGTNAKSNVIGRVNTISTCTTNCNLISGNSIGISVNQAGTGNKIQANYIGTTLNGLAALPNNIGIKVDTTSQTIIGSSPLTTGAGSIISGNTTDGILLRTATTTTIQGNYIGLASNKTSALGNGDDGIELMLTSTNNLIGQSNVIANNGGDGIVVSSDSTGNRFIQTTTYANSGLGVDLLPVGITSNDAGDGDTGANGLQNFPLLTDATYTGSATAVSGTLNSKPNLTYIIQFFGNTVCDPSGSGEAETFLGSTTVTTDATGNVTFSANVTSAASKYITASATDSTNNTSEFSPCLQALIPPASFKLTVPSSTAINLSWVDNSAVENEYHVERSFDGSTNWTEIAVLPADSTSYTDNTVTCNVPYYYRVRAYRTNPAQYSGYTTVLNTKTLCSLNAPTALNAVIVQTNRVGLTWVDNSNNESKFNVERSLDGITGWTLVGTTSQDFVTFTDGAVACDKIYFYRIQAAHTNGQTSNYSNVAQINLPLCTPTSFIGSHTVDTSIDLTWIDNSTAETGYKIERSVNGPPSTWIEIASLPANTTSFSDTNLTCASIYTYRVLAFRALDSSYSANVVTFTMPKCPPADLSLTHSASNPSPGEGEPFNLTITVSNGGPNIAPNVVVSELLNSKLSFISASASQGSYNQATGKWTIGTIAVSSSSTLIITARPVAGSQGIPLANTAEIIASDALDPDSTPDNRASSEDDQALVIVTVSCAPASIFNVAAGDTDGLITAMVAANNETCHPGTDTITLAPNSTYNLTQVYVNDLDGPSGLPPVTSPITIEGNGSTIQRSGSTAFRILAVTYIPVPPYVGGNLTLNRLTISNGLANQTNNNPNYLGAFGGGILNDAFSTLTINNSIITSNGATFMGGGLYNRGTSTITNSLFYNNRSISFSVGAAILNDGTATITNSTFSKNQSDASNSSIVYNNGPSNLSLTNSTFAENIASNNGGDILQNNSGTFYIRGNLFADSNVNTCSGYGLVSSGYNYSDDNSCATYFTQATDLNNTTLKMGILANNGGYTQTYAPAVGNPAIEAIPTVDCTVTTDQTGATRPIDSDGDGTPKCEVGALELGQADLNLQSVVDLATANVGDTLHFSIQFSNNGPDNALGVVVGYPISSKLTYIASSASQGTFDPITGYWNIGQVNVGSSVTLNVTTQINYSAATGSILQKADLIGASVNDPAGAPSASSTVTVSGCATGVAFNIANGDVNALIDAIDAANNESCYPGPNTINLASNGTYTFTAIHPDNSSESNALPLITSDIVIEGHNSTLQRDNAAPAFRLFMVPNGGHLTLNSATIQGGSAVNGGAISNAGTLSLNTSAFLSNTAYLLGGAVYNSGTLVVTGGTLSFNNAAVGGAIYSTSTLTLSNAALTGNAATYAVPWGGAVNIAGGTATITGSTFSNNTTYVGNSGHGGGGAIAVFGTLTLSNSSLLNNQTVGTYGTGGGLYINSAGTATVSNSTFDSNKSPGGAGIYVDYGTLNLSASTFSNNTASNQGGGLYVEGTANITNSTFSANKANTAGGAIGIVAANVQINYSTFYGNLAPTGSAIDQHGITTITASVIAKNSGSACSYGGVGSGGYNISDDISCSFHNTGDKMGIDPLLGALANNGGPTKTHAPQNFSPLFNNIPQAACTTLGVTTDQRGTARPQGTDCDSGAYEGSGTPIYPTFTITNVNTVADTGDGKLLESEVTDASITQFSITFNRPAQDTAGDTDPNDVTNPANYRLVRDGANAIFQTLSCTAAVGDDILVPINSVTYDPNTYTATLSVNGGAEIPSDDYRLIACASLKDLNGSPLDGNQDNNAGDNFILGFRTNTALFNADLVVTQTDAPDPVLVNGTLTYTVTIANLNGPQKALNVVLTDTIPTGVTFNSAPGCTNTNGVLTCNLGTILRGESKAVTITLTVGATTIVTLTNKASATSSVTDPIPANNTNINENTIANEPPATNLVVNTTADSTDGVCGLINCSLRDAITSANLRAGTDTITFNIPGTAPYSIKPTSALPAIGEAVILDGWSQPGYINKPIIEIDGTSAGSSAVGLTITSGGSMIRGLVINNFKSDGLVLNNLGGNTIVGNYIGTDTTGNVAKGNLDGIVITNSPSNMIGGVIPSERNIISGNKQTGLTVSGATSTGNVIRGNFIGTNAVGTSGLANDWGVSISASNTTIGGTIGTTPGGNCTGACNIISYSTRTGLGIFGAANNITVQGNFIGTDVTGTINLGNGSGPWTGHGEEQSGIYVHDGPHTGTIVGGSTPAARNIISGSAIYGIYFSTNDAVTNGQTTVQGNYIGTDTTGTIAIPNQGGGIQLYTINNIIKSNLISGNNAAGVDARVGPNTIQGNYIGTTASGNAPLPNNGGISASGQNIIIGGSALGQGNVIAGNNGTGISLGSNSSILGNRIGTDITGTLILGNNGYGINATQGSNDIIGGINPGEANTIANNIKAGVYLYSTNTNSNAIRGNSIYNNGGLGIDLQATNGVANDGVTPNDVGDADVGGNKLQNFPTLSNVAFNSGQITINGSLNSTANATFDLDFFASPTCDTLGNGEGQLYLGHSSQTTNGTGNVTFSLTQAASFPSGYFVTATATDTNSNTSEFSNCVTSIQPPTNLKVVRITSTEIQLTWVDNSTEESSFRIERSLDATTGWTEIDSVSPNVTLYNQSGLNCETTYYYRVRGQVTDTDYSAYSNTVSIRPCMQQGPIFTVTSTSSTDDGTCDYANCTLREAIRAANLATGQQTINLASNATYTFNVADNNTSGSNALPAVTGNIVINGNGAIIERSLVDGTPQFRLILVGATGTLTINDLTVRNGFVQGNTTWMTGRGGGIANEGGQLTVNRSTITANTADYDSGIGNLRNGTLMVNSSTISNNQGGYGPGGIGNEKEGYYDPAGIVTITNSTISGNVAGSGGAVSNASAVTGSGVMTIIHSTIANNNSINPTILNGSQPLILRDTIVTANARATGTVCSTAGNPNITSQGYNIIGDNTCNLTGTGDLNGVNPFVNPLANNGGATQTHSLQPSSPAIDHVPAAVCTVTTDQRGVARPVDGNNNGVADCDSGAFEGSTAVIADLSLANVVSNTTPSFGSTITYTLTLTNHGPNIANNIAVKDLLPSGLTFTTSTASQGTYNTGSGIWDVGTLASNNVAELAIKVTINNGQVGLSIHNSAEIIQSSALDLDSTPNNNNPTEDDQATVDVLVACSTAPFNVAAGDAAGLVNAITAANNESCYPGENVITLAAGSTYTLTTANNTSGNSANGLPDVTSVITINGNGAIMERSLSNGTPQFRLAHITTSGNLTLNGLTLQNGSTSSSGNGGAIYNEGTLSISNSTLSNNTATSYGGAVYTLLGRYLTVLDSHFINNSSLQGGALYNQPGTVVSISNSTFIGNSSEELGGAIFNRGNLRVGDGTNMSSNTTNSNGSAIFNGVNGTLLLSESTLADNIGHDIGAIDNDGGTATISNSTLSGNSMVTDEANAVMNAGDGTLIIENSTLSGGSANGSLIYNSSGTTTVKATILYGAPGRNCVQFTGNIISAGYNVTDDSSCSAYLTQPTDQNGVNPSLNALANNGGNTATQSLTLNSPAVDALPAELCGTSKDQRGINRPQGSACDIGAYELQTSLPKPSSLNPAATVTSITLTWNDTFNETEYRVERSPNGVPNWTEIAVVAANITTYVDSPLSCATAYSYRVRAYRSGENLFSPYSNIISQTTSACPPADLSISVAEGADPVYAGSSQTYTLTVRNLSAVSAQNVLITDTLPSGTTFQSVNASNPVTCQQTNGVVNCNLDSLSGNSQQTITLNVGLNTATRGTINNIATVSSTTADNNTANNLSTTVTTIILPPTAPAAPLLTSPAIAVQLNTGTQTLTWNAVVYPYNSLSYEVMVDNTATFASPEFTMTGLNTTSVTTTALADGTYSWRVRSINVLGAAGNWSAVRTFTIDSTPPLAPALSAPATGVIVANARPTFSWLTVVGANRYRLQVDDDSAFGSPEINVFPITTLTYALITSLQQGTYNWRVQAYDAAGNSGAFSAVRTFKVNIQLTPAQAAVLAAAPTITFTWQPVSTATGYQLQVATDAAFTADLTNYAVNNGTIGTLTVPAASVAGTYYWRVNVNLGSGLVSSPFYRSFTAPKVGPLVPTLLNPIPAYLSSSNAVTLSWSSIKDLTGHDMTYQIQVDNTITFVSPEYTVNGLGSTVTITTPLADGVYSWRARSISSTNMMSAWSAVRTFTVDTLPPPAPIVSTPANNVMLGSARPTFSWPMVAGANRYRLQVDDDPLFGSPEINAFPLTNVPPSTTVIYTLVTSLQQGTYNWRVQAYDAAGNSGPFSVVHVFKVNVQLTPANGAILIATPAITFTWQPVPTATGYQLQFATDAAFTANVTNYAVNTGTIGTLAVPAASVEGIYFWRVNVNLGSGLVTSPFYRSFIAPKAAPLAPALVSPANALASNNTAISLSWSTVKDLVGRDMAYQVQVDNTPTYVSPEFVAANLTGTSTTTTTLANGVYSWRVRAISSTNLMGAWSAVRTFIVDTLPPPAPVLSTPAAGVMLANARPTFSWLTVIGANRYRLQVDDDPLFASPNIDAFPITTLSYALVSSLQQGTYYWRVQAYDAAGNAGAFSAVRLFKLNVQLTPANGAVLIAAPTITFTWQPVPTATGYQLQVATDAAFTTNLTNYAVNSGAIDSMVVPGAAIAGTYYWRINVNLGSGLVTSPFLRSFIAPKAAPLPPALVSPVMAYSSSAKTVTLTWVSVTDLVGRAVTYQIQVDNTVTFISPEYTVTNLNTTSATTTALANGTYNWRVRAISSTNTAGAWSAVRTFKVVP